MESMYGMEFNLAAVVPVLSKWALFFIVKLSLMGPCHAGYKLLLVLEVSCDSLVLGVRDACPVQGKPLLVLAVSCDSCEWCEMLVIGVSDACPVQGKPLLVLEVNCDSLVIGVSDACPVQGKPRHTCHIIISNNKLIRNG